MRNNVGTVTALVALVVIAGCDQRIPQTVIVRGDVPNAALESVWLVESAECEDNRMEAGWFRDGLWIFRISSTRGGIDTVTQELSVCVSNGGGNAQEVWHTLHGGGASLLVLSCDLGQNKSCRMYQDGYQPGVWSEDPR